MNTNTQAWGWVAAGVLALGMNSLLHDNSAELAHRIMDRAADRAEMAVDMAREKADGMIARADMFAARLEVASCRVKTAIAMVKSAFSDPSEQSEPVVVMSASMQEPLARFEANRAEIEAKMAKVQVLQAKLSRVKINPVQYHAACSEIRVQPTKQQIPEIRIQTPMVGVPAHVVQVSTRSGPV